MTSDVVHGSSFGSSLRAGASALALMALFLLVTTAQVLHAQTFTVLHTFEGPDGANPFGQLQIDSAGNLYGTTPAGGDLAKCNLQGCGTVFMLDSAGNQTVLHSFKGRDGYRPEGNLLRTRSGDLYGTTVYGGAQNWGSIFKMDSAGHLRTIYSFDYSPDAWGPRSLTRDKLGNLYGTSAEGGLYGEGAVFKLDRTSGESVLYSFTQGMPFGGVIVDASGNVYGTTWDGGDFGYGSVFKLDATGAQTVLHSFQQADGQPTSGLVGDLSGNLYGTTPAGGTYGAGWVFKVNSHSGQTDVLYSFAGGSDGWGQKSALVRDAAGNLYGTTTAGGVSQVCGTVYRLDMTGHETILYSFTCGADGGTPYSSLTFDKSGNLYGTTGYWGDSLCPIYGGCGVVFKITF